MNLPKWLMAAGLLMLPIMAPCCRIGSEPLPAPFKDDPAAFARLKFKEFYESADVVYETTATQIQDFAENDRRTKNTVHVDHVWKQDGGQIEELIAGHGGGDCTIGLTVGHRQIVFAKRESAWSSVKSSEVDPLYATNSHLVFAMFRDEIFQTTIADLFDRLSRARTASVLHEFLESIRH